MPSAYFVSDIHITSPADARAQLFLDFLGRLSGANGVSHLFLMGDIFDLWVAGHRFFIERYADIIAEIRRLRDDGVEIHYFEGNHDLHLERFWADELGLTVHSGPAVVSLGNLTLRLEHGDQMDPDDRGYRFLRWFLRTPPVRFLICNLPGALIARVGDRASATSRVYTNEMKVISDADAITKIRTHARLAHANEPFDVIVSGHVHVRDDFESETGNGRFRSINLGSWLDAPCYLHIESDTVRLVDLTPASAPETRSPDAPRARATP